MNRNITYCKYIFAGNTMQIWARDEANRRECILLDKTYEKSRKFNDWDWDAWDFDTLESELKNNDGDIKDIIVLTEAEAFVELL